jgi:hypothetical protein
MGEVLIGLFGIKGALLCLAGLVVYAVLMNFWFFWIGRRTRPGSVARARAMACYMMGCGGLAVLQIVALVIYLRG